jgi:hypothetical protein
MKSNLKCGRTGLSVRIIIGNDLVIMCDLKREVTGESHITKTCVAGYELKKPHPYKEELLLISGRMWARLGSDSVASVGIIGVELPCLFTMESK